MRRNETVLFSVIMPVYNGARFIREAIESVVNQTFPSWELLIIDDGSKDGSLEISMEWSLKDSRIKVLYHEGYLNKGVSASRNLGIRNVSGDWISFLDADDLWLTAKLEKEYLAIKLNHSATIIYSIAEVIDMSAPEKPVSTYGKGKSGLLEDPFQKTIEGFQGHISSVSVKKETILEKDLFFREDMRFAEDTLFMHEVLIYGDLFFIPEILSIYRFHNNSSCKGFEQDTIISGRLTVYEKMLFTHREYSTEISRALVITGLEKIWKSFLLHPTIYHRMLSKSLKRVLGNKDIKPRHKLLVFTGPFRVMLNAFKRRMSRNRSF